MNNNSLQVKKDLQEIKYYYSRKKVLDEGFGNTGNNTVIEILTKYNKIAKEAPAKLYDLYISLYLKNHTQDSLAIEMGVTQSYIYQQNRKLIGYFAKNLFEGEETNV